MKRRRIFTTVISLIVLLATFISTATMWAVPATAWQTGRYKGSSGWAYVYPAYFLQGNLFNQPDWCNGNMYNLHSYDSTNDWLTLTPGGVISFQIEASTTNDIQPNTLNYLGCLLRAEGTGSGTLTVDVWNIDGAQATQSVTIANNTTSLQCPTVNFNYAGDRGLWVVRLAISGNISKVHLEAIAIGAGSKVNYTSTSGDLSPHYSETGAYQITYNANGGTGAPSNVGTTWYGGTRTPTFSTGTIPTRTGYTFNGWDYDWTSGVETHKSSTSITVSPTSPISKPGAIATYGLTAKWTATPYNITYNNMDGATNFSGAPSTYTIESAAITLGTPTKAGYTFEGWYTDAALTTAATSIPQGSTGNKVFYAKWTLNTFDYTLGTDPHVDTTGSTASGNYAPGADITLNATPSPGYSFDKWQSSDTSLVPDQTEANTTITMPSGALTMTPVVSPNTYDIIYDVSGGDALENGSFVYNVGSVGDFPTATKNGYTFDGWLLNGTLVTAIPANTYAEDVTLTAKWTATSYTITYYLDGGTNYDGAPTSYTIESPTITLGTPTKAGSTFGGWYTDAALTAATTSIPQGSTGDKVFYVKWNAAGMTVIYAVIGGTGGTLSIEGETVTADASQGSTPTAATGYHFVGWFTDDAGTNPVDAQLIGEGNKLTPAYDADTTEVTYYAKFALTFKTMVLSPALSGEGTFKDGETFIFTVNIVPLAEGLSEASVTVAGDADGTASIDLPLGTYTIIVQNSWSWRYEAAEVSGTLTDASADETTVTVTFVASNDNWANGYSPVLALPESKEKLMALVENDDDGDDDLPGIL